MRQNFNYYNPGQRAVKIEPVGVSNHNFNINFKGNEPPPLLQSISQNNQKVIIIKYRFF